MGPGKVEGCQQQGQEQPPFFAHGEFLGQDKGNSQFLAARQGCLLKNNLAVTCAAAPGQKLIGSSRHLSLHSAGPKSTAMASSQRFLALDVFRGMTVCFMIIVNTSGNGPTTWAPLEHAAWHGFTPTDLVFPSFLFAVGNAMSFVMARWAEKSQAEVLGKIFKRTLLIFLIGYLMYWFPFVRKIDGHLVLAPISHTRILGVLQRIALCYGIASLLIYYLKPKGALAVSILLLLGYWALLYLFGVPGQELTMTGNAGIRLDKFLMGEDHMYHGEGIAFDPEGWLSTLPAIANVVAGFWAGSFVQRQGRTYEGLAKLLLAGFGLLVLAYFWDLGLPINKKLWTSSFVVYTVGLDCIILSAVIYCIDFLHRTRWTRFFEVFGKNPLFIYILSEILVTILYMIPMPGQRNLFHWLYGNIFRHAGAYFGAFLFAVTYMLVCWIVGYWLDKRKIYVRV
jgi:predicted acyltransferase